MKKTFLLFFLGALSLIISSALRAANIAYIHGNVDQYGLQPNDPGYTTPFHQMLLTDTSDDGCSLFKEMVEAEGHTISQHYDAEIQMDATFLEQFDVLVFGLHQRVWSEADQAAIDIWLRAGGGIFTYNDSAASGRFTLVPDGIKSTVGQDAVNSIISKYGMQVCIDNGGGTRSYAYPTTSPIDISGLEFEGEGVAPVAVDVENTTAQAIIPLTRDNLVAESKFREMPHDPRNITIENPVWACLAYNGVDDGKVMVMFDRQPMWNNGGGSNIQAKDNMEVLRRVINFLAEDVAVEDTPPTVDLSIEMNGSGEFIVTADAQDDDGIDRVVAWLRPANGTWKPLHRGEETAEGFVWNLGFLANGEYTVRVVAYGNGGDDDRTLVYLDVLIADEPDPVDPTIVTTVEIDGSGAVFVSANAQDDSPILRVILWYTEVGTTPWTRVGHGVLVDGLYTWSLGVLPAGDYHINAKAFAEDSGEVNELLTITIN